ncbi:MAG: DUF1801 domain-containing protein [Chitinophagaceae bacterium]|nr:DUF1801 domain-containing protein [Chitinophagaceae bacterium]MCB9055033.1 DUF1801 domain-containing protein [Chitinophagales bacterium]
MKDLRIKTDPKAKKVFDGYPVSIRKRMDKLRMLIIDTARESEDVEDLIETLKWGEPSYLTRTGSTIRIDWKEKSPDQYAMYFQCTSRLVPTFKIVFGKTFQYEGTRAIIFNLKERLPEAELKQCIKAGLLYHKVKQLPLLGL